MDQPGWPRPAGPAPLGTQAETGPSELGGGKGCDRELEGRRLPGDPEDRLGAYE